MAFRRRPPAFLAMSLAAVVVASCAANTPVRRSALVPAPGGPAAVGRPLDNEEMRAGLELNPWLPASEFLSAGTSSRPGDPGLFIPAAQIGAFFLLGAASNLEVGAHARYAPRAWAHANVSGVLEIPDSEETAALTGGLTLRASVRPAPDTPITLALSTDFNLARITQAVFVCATNPCVAQAGQTSPTYNLDRLESHLYFLPNIFVHFGVDVAPWVHLFALTGAEAGLKNIGFDPDLSRLSESTLKVYPIVLVGTGAELRVRPVFLSLVALWPLESEEAIHFGPAVQVQTGLLF